MKIFIEQQRFNQWWFRGLMLIVILIIIGSIIKSYPTLEENSPDYWVMLGSTSFAIIVVLIVTFIFKLDTRIDELGIHYAFFPIHLKKKNIQWSEVRECSVTKYNPISDYGGWGYKVMSFRKKGAALNVKGNIGIQIVFKNGKQLLIGTQKENEAKRVLETYTHKINSL